MFRLEWLPFLRRYIWKNTGFSGLRSIRDTLEQYETCYEPLIIPSEKFSADKKPAAKEIPSSKPPTKIEPGLYYSVADYQAFYRSGELTPLAVAKAILPLIRRDETPPGAYSDAWFEHRIDLIYTAAKASTLRWKQGKPLGPLDGIPTGM